MSTYRHHVLVRSMIGFIFALRRSFFLTLFVLGIVIFVLGATVIDGVLAGMMGIWGATLIFIGGGLYGSFWLIRYVVRERERSKGTHENAEHGSV
jgi:pilus assembly protein TadC